ncbi:MAG: hypothetical protein E6X43_04710 [Peptostreptococcaceae bacterium]|nr:hypothetical protein [Peptostreptococcaceae bacterium]
MAEQEARIRLINAKQRFIESLKRYKDRVKCTMYYLALFLYF